MGISLEDAQIIAKWFSLPERHYKSYSIDTLEALVKVHFTWYSEMDIRSDIEAILAVI
jgi:hypothetical protein